MPPFVSQIEPDDAPAVIARMYDASIKERGFIYNNWKVMAHAEKVLRGYNQFITAVLNPEELSKRTLELAILKATLLNKCYY